MAFKQLLSLSAFHAIIWVGTALAVLAFIVRAYIRVRLFGRLLLDDWLLMFALAMLMASAALQQPTLALIYMLLRVLNKIEEPGPNFTHDATVSARAFGVAYLFYTLGVYAVKLGFLVFFYRLGSRITLYLVLWWGVVLITIGFGAATIGIVNYSCEFGELEDMIKRCTNPASLGGIFDMFRFSVIMDLVTDALIICFPLLILWKVRVSMKKKIILAGVFGLVAFTIIVTSFRSSVFNSEIKDITLGTVHTINIAWSWFWHHVQLSVSIIIACLVSFRALFCHPSSSTTKQQIAREYYRQRRERFNQASDLEKFAGISRTFQKFHDTLLETCRELEDPDQINGLPKPPLAGDSSSIEAMRSSQQELWHGGGQFEDLEGGVIMGSHKSEGPENQEHSDPVTPLGRVYCAVGPSR